MGGIMDVINWFRDGISWITDEKYWRYLRYLRHVSEVLVFEDGFKNVELHE
jgi:hypothetical protein